MEGQSGGGKAEAGVADCAVGLSEKLLVVSLFVSQGRLSLHLLTLWEEPGSSPGQIEVGAEGFGRIFILSIFRAADVKVING